MQKETRRNSAAGSAKPNPPRKLTRAEKKQIAEIIRQAKGDGKAHTAQQTIPYSRAVSPHNGGAVPHRAQRGTEICGRSTRTGERTGA